LTLADNPHIGVLWCKEPLGHNGERRKDGGRQVVFVGQQGIQFVTGADWPAFLRMQEELLKHRDERETSGVPLVSGIVELPDGTLTDSISSDYTLKEESKGNDFSGNGSQSGGALRSSDLVWYRPPFRNGSVKRTLSFSNLISEPVTVTFTNGMPDVTNFVFKMRRKL
jgi:hypothetical protein